MKRVFLTTLVLVTAGLVAAVPLYAQGGRGAKKSQQGYYRMYNTNTVETVEGTVTGVRYRPGKVAGIEGVELSVETAGTVLPVHLGPRWYIEQQDQVEEGDRVTVTGSRITFEGESVLIAATVTLGGKTLTLRDKQGFPVWRGWRFE